MEVTTCDHVQVHGRPRQAPHDRLRISHRPGTRRPAHHGIHKTRRVLPRLHGPSPLRGRHMFPSTSSLSAALSSSASASRRFSFAFSTSNSRSRLPRRPHAAVFRLPAVDRVLRNAMTAGQIRHRGTGLVLLQNGNDLFFGVALALHTGTTLGQNYREIPQTTCLELGGRVNVCKLG
jgi:hypothetical protein